MTVTTLFLLLFHLLFALADTVDQCNQTDDAYDESSTLIVPKVMIVSMWAPESDVWHTRFHEMGMGNLSAQAIFTPAMSMLYPEIICNEAGEICHVVLGEGEINAASTMMALLLSTRFDFRRTYWVCAGIAGVNPERTTIGSVAIARYAIQVGLQYEIDSRELPESWPSGYIPYGREYPFLYPNITYGSEVFELNGDLQLAAYKLGSNGTLSDSAAPANYRKLYAQQYPLAGTDPVVVTCDVATSDVYYSGNRLAQAFDATAQVWTNGSAKYCMSAQEENAYLEVMVRVAIEGLVDFGRIIVLRGGSNFDRPPPTISDWQHLVQSDQNAFYVSLDNLFNVGSRIIRGIITDWNCTFGNGIKPSNYIGDIFGSLGGLPDFGLGSLTDGQPVKSMGSGKSKLRERSMQRRGGYRK